MKVEYPANHKPGMRVPKGGSSCASCEYYKGSNKCGNRYFIKWHGSNVIPAPPDQYCSDWYEPKTETGKDTRVLKTLRRGLEGKS